MIPKTNSQPPLVACDVCMSEVPLTQSRSEEVEDYVMHFCGLECYEQWKTQNEDKHTDPYGESE